MEILFSALCEAIFSVLITHIAERPQLAQVLDSLRGKASEKAALQHAFAAAYLTFSEKYPELANSFFDEIFLSKREVIIELSKLLIPDQSPDPTVLVRLWQTQFHQEPQISLQEPLEFLLNSIDNKIKAQPLLRSFVDSRALDKLHAIASSVAGQTALQKEMVGLLREMRNLIDKGDANLSEARNALFEGQVLDVLKFLPGVKVEEHVMLSGKEVFALCKVHDLIGGSSTVAFECIDSALRVTYKQVNHIIRDYKTLIQQNLIDRVCLITRNGIDVDAERYFDGKARQHLTYEELLGRLLESNVLINNMINRFTLEDLDQYYIEATCYDIPMSWVSRHFHLVYNEFIDFALSSEIEYLQTAANLWQKYAPDHKARTLPEQYTDAVFLKVLATRRSKQRIELESVILSWAKDKTIQQALAILGSYGTGKSSFAKRFAHVWAKRYKQGKTDRIPLLIELRDFGSQQDIRGLITHELINRHGTRYGSYESFQLLNRQGKFLLILDGFDEMKQGLSRDVIIYNFNELNKLYSPQSKIILCGRPTIFSSENEQSSILSGTSDIGFTHAVEYIQLNIAPFTQKDILTFFSNYMRIRDKREKSYILNLVEKLRRELPRNKDLSSLLARPVHLPMLATVLPELKGDISTLKRAKLYELFINKSISREVLKQGLELRENYDTNMRREFTSELAVQMFRSGESRSIHYSEIPDHMIQRFRRPGRNLDSTKRDLIAAGFLERKPPDILFFGHKSFAEYLVAERVVSLMNEHIPRTDQLRLRFSPEVISFVTEMAPSNGWINVALNPEHNTLLLDRALNLLLGSPREGIPFEWTTFQSALEQDGVIHAWNTKAHDIPPMALYRLVVYLTDVFQTAARYSDASEAFLKKLLDLKDDFVVIHAYRSLAAKNMITGSDLLQKIGTKRFEEWKRMKWL